MIKFPFTMPWNCWRFLCWMNEKPTTIWKSEQWISTLAEHLWSVMPLAGVGPPGSHTPVEAGHTCKYTQLRENMKLKWNVQNENKSKKICLSMQGMWVWSPCQEDLLEKEMVTHYSILAWEISWTEEPSGLQSWCCRVWYNLATKQKQWKLSNKDEGGADIQTVTLILGGTGSNDIPKIFKLFI